MEKDKFKIIEPFLNGEKQLKEISAATDVSYTTLKRWVKQYREGGEEGLKNKTRADKNSFRTVDDSFIKKLEKFYVNNKEKPLLSIYKELENKFDSFISFNTFYRVISNLDSYLKNSSNLQISKNIKNGDMYIIKQFVSYNFVKYKNTSVLPVITLAFNAANLDFVNFHVSFEKNSSNFILPFLRNTIIKGFHYYKTTELPKELLIDQNYGLVNNQKELILGDTGIKILDYTSPNEDIEKFINYLNEDITAYFKELLNPTLNHLLNFLAAYINYPDIIYFDNVHSNIDKLYIFLPKIKRKVHKYGVKINRILYNSSLLENHIGEIAEIYYDPLNPKKIEVNIGETYLGELFSGD